MITFKKGFTLICVALIYFILSVFIHELGHGIVGKILGMGNLVIAVWPGVEIFPEMGTLNHIKHWPGSAVAVVSFIPEVKSLSVDIHREFNSYILEPILNIKHSSVVYDQRRVAVVLLMGSGTTYLISLLCTFFLWLCSPVGILKKVCVFGAFMFYDLLCYSIFPVFFDLRHLIFIGGKLPEPVIALEQLGMPLEISVTLIVIMCCTQAYFLKRLLSKE